MLMNEPMQLPFAPQSEDGAMNNLLNKLAEAGDHAEEIRLLLVLAGFDFQSDSRTNEPR